MSPFSATQEITNIISEFKATTQETTQEIEESTQETTPEISEKIIQLIEKNPKLTRRAIADLIGISDNGVKYHLKKLRREGRITHVGPTKKGYWEIISP
jgi:ATP-dependent DNA helicase RecG